MQIHNLAKSEEEESPEELLLILVRPKSPFFLQDMFPNVKQHCSFEQWRYNFKFVGFSLCKISLWCYVAMLSTLYSCGIFNWHCGVKNDAVVVVAQLNFPFSYTILLLCEFFIVFLSKIALLSLLSSTSCLLAYFSKNTNKTYKKLIKTH